MRTLTNPLLFGCFVLFLFLCFCTEAKQQDQDGGKRKGDDEELLFVHAFWRRGDSGPAWDPTTPDIPGQRQFDPDGLAKMFKLGLLLRSRYVGQLLDPINYVDQIYFQSVDNFHALTDVQAVQAAMFPEHVPQFAEVEGWPSNWQPAAFHTKPKKTDILYLSPDCLPFYQAQSKAVKEIVGKSDKETQDIYHRLIKATELPQDTSASDVYRAVMDASEFDPFWNKRKSATLDKLKNLARDETKAFAKNQPMIRLKAGPIFQDILNRTKTKLETIKNLTRGEGNPNCTLCKMDAYGYAQWDTRVASVREDFWQLSALTGDGGSSTEDPSSIVYELWRIGGKHFMKVLYCQSCDEKNDFKPLNIVGCPKQDPLCPLETFEAALQPYLGIFTLAQMQSECGIGRAAALDLANDTETQEDFSLLAIIFGIVVGILVIVSLNLFYMLMTQRRESQGDYVVVDERSSLLGK